jgi:hypothetical protein
MEHPTLYRTMQMIRPAAVSESRVIRRHQVIAIGEPREEWLDRNTSCDPHLHQAIEQPMLPTSREASAARAATSKRASVDRTDQIPDGELRSNGVLGLGRAVEHLKQR